MTRLPTIGGMALCAVCPRYSFYAPDLDVIFGHKQSEVVSLGESHRCRNLGNQRATEPIWCCCCCCCCFARNHLNFITCSFN